MPTAAELSDHIVVAGADGFAARVLRELHHVDERVVALVEDAASALAGEALDLGVPIVIGPARAEATLREAGLDRAAGLALLFDGDVTNLHAALVGEELAPDVPVVLRMFNTTFGHNAARLIGGCTVLSEAELAAPAFTHAALFGNASLPIELDHRRLGVRVVAPDDPALVLALADADDHARLFPAPDSAAQVIALVEERDGDERTDLAELAVAVLRSTTLTPLQTLALLARELAAGARGRIGAAFGLLMLMVLASSAIFWIGLDISPLDAVYFTVVTVATVGYGDINLKDAPWPVQLYGMGVVLAGGVTIAVLYALVTDAIVGLRIAAALGDPDPPTADHVIVSGLGNVGTRVAAELCARGVPCVGVERDEGAAGLPELRRLGIPVVIADAGRADTLARLNVPTARAVVAVTDDDIANLDCALSARALSPGARVVVRLGDADLARRVERTVDIHISRSVSALAAPSFVAELLDRRLLATIPVGARTLRIRPLQARAGTTVDTIEQLTDEARVLQAGDVWRPGGEVAIGGGGGEVLVIGTSVGLATVERALA